MKCEYCGNYFQVKSKPRRGATSKYCSTSCSKSRKLVHIKQCQYCFICYETRRPKQKFCTRYCRSLGRRSLKNKKYVCVVCLSDFIPNYKKQACCSTECAKIKETLTKMKTTSLKIINLLNTFNQI